MAQVVNAESTFKLNDIVVYDQTVEQKGSACRCVPQTILWDNLHFYYDSSQDGLIGLNLSKSSNTHSVVITNGAKSNCISIFQRIMNPQDKSLKIAWSAEINTSEHITHKQPNIDKSNFVDTLCLIARPIAKKTDLDPVTPFLLMRFPIDDSCLSQYERTLLNQVVSGSTLPTEQHDHLLASNAKYQEIFKQKASRVHLFKDGYVRLFDATQRGIVQITEDSSKNQGISLNGIPVEFNFQLKGNFSGEPFKSGAPHYCNHVFVIDDPDANYVSISIKESKRPRESKAQVKCYYVSVNASKVVYQAQETLPLKFPYADVAAIEDDCKLDPMPLFDNEEVDQL